MLIFSRMLRQIAYTCCCRALTTSSLLGYCHARLWANTKIALASQMEIIESKCWMFVRSDLTRNSCEKCNYKSNKVFQTLINNS
jgi:hypothetical protein